MDKSRFPCIGITTIEYEAFLQQILQKGEGKTKGEQVALIAEPGAGKTTLLQAIADWN
ncbi:hypothetical protein [Crocosphaera sp.]|uniref:hypothetical protein n=1 Tax=Crocosphaera sp. TaxID=2729996 RepID=UPI00262FA32C|nr:hypothetical protein [Crocosphaera sp.]MDJ0580299.1 hypothetical protein [Crocosphaera sp.]